MTTAGLKFNNWRRDFDYSGVEINCAASGRLKRFAGSRNHSPAHKAAGIAKDFLRTPFASVDQKIELRFQSDHSTRWRCDKHAFPVKAAPFCSEILHMRNRSSKRLAAFARS